MSKRKITIKKNISITTNNYALEDILFQKQKDKL